MNTKSTSHWLFWIGFIVLTVITRSPGQTIPEGRSMRWDGTRGVATFGYGMVRPDSLPIRTYTGGTQRGGDISLFHDFPNLKQALVKDVAAGPSGTTVVVAQLQDREDQLKVVVLTFDEAGHLSKIWNTFPYNPEGITVDDDGSVYMVGFRIDSKRGGPSYPLLVHYSNDGRVIGEGLPSSTFEKKDEAIYSDLGNFAVVTLRNGQLFVFAPAGREIVVCTKEGKPIKRLQLTPILENITKGDQLDKFELHDLAFLGNNHAVINLFGADSKGKRALASTRLVNISTGLVKTLESGKNIQPLIGAIGNEVIFMRRNGNELSIQRQVVNTQE
jgi:hypothetical protein